MRQFIIFIFLLLLVSGCRGLLINNSTIHFDKISSQDLNAQVELYLNNDTLNDFDNSTGAEIAKDSTERFYYKNIYLDFLKDRIVAISKNYLDHYDDTYSLYLLSLKLDRYSNDSLHEQDISLVSRYFYKVYLVIVDNVNNKTNGVILVYSDLESNDGLSGDSFVKSTILKKNKIIISNVWTHWCDICEDIKPKICREIWRIAKDKKFKKIKGNCG